MPDSHTLPKDERLRGKRNIDELFSAGESGFAYPFRYFWYTSDLIPEAEPSGGIEGKKPAILFAVPKKLFKRAVKRNILKRRMREAYRLNKNILVTHTSEKQINIAFIYASKDELDFNTIENGIKRILAAIAKNI